MIYNSDTFKMSKVCDGYKYTTETDESLTVLSVPDPLSDLWIVHAKTPVGRN